MENITEEMSHESLKKFEKNCINMIAINTTFSSR